MNWVLDGYVVEGLYIGKFPFRGIVKESRVALGGRIKYVVQVAEPIEVFGEKRDLISVEDTELEVLY